MSYNGPFACSPSDIPCSGALLSPPPLALVMGYPVLEINNVLSTSAGYFVPASTPGHLRPLLNADQVGQAEIAKSSVPDMPMVLDKAPYAKGMQSRCGMDAREPWKGKEESVRRQGLTEFLLKDDRLDALLRKASPDLILPSDLLLAKEGQQAGRNQPYPPTLIFHGLNDTLVSPDSSRRFIDVIRTAEPVAATMDALAAGLSPPSVAPHQRDQAKTEGRGAGRQESAELDASMSAALRCVPSDPNHTSRYLFLGMEGPGAGHAFDALLPRELRSPPFDRTCPKTIGDRYKASMIHVERWIQHWVLEGSAERAAAQEASRIEQRKQHESDESHNQAMPISVDNDRLAPSGGSRIRVPIRGPRL